MLTYRASATCVTDISLLLAVCVTFIWYRIYIYIHNIYNVYIIKLSNKEHVQ